jgi:hypothetical protein
MALKKIMTLTGNRILQLPFGSINEGSSTLTIVAIARVAEISGNSSRVNARVNFTDGTITFDKNFIVPVSVENNEPNFIRQVYLYLKTLPEFDNCEDC